MENFVYDIKTKAYFGKNQIENLGQILEKYGKKVLFVYGQGSIKKNGIYDKIIEIAKENNLELVEFSGVEPNPLLSTVKKGIELAKSQNVDCILAVGGGSAVDCAKAIGTGVKYNGDVWDFFCGKAAPKDSLPVVGIVTLAASGTEMSPFSAITNEETTQKNGMMSDIIRLNEVILDPTYTYSVNAFHSACGVADAMSHIMEGYFSNNNEYLQDRMCEAVLKTLIYYGPKILENPQDYEARAQVFWDSTIAINRILNYGLKFGCYECHIMGQALSAKYNITHGLSLTLVHPKWYEFCIKSGKTEKFVTFGRNVWGLDSDDETVAKKSIEELSKFFFDTLKLPKSLSEVIENIDKADLKKIAETTSKNYSSENWYAPTKAEDIEEIYNSIY